MREIKFRAWIYGGIDEDVKPYMTEVAAIEIDVDQLIIKEDMYDNWYCASEYHLMQFTGLKDKNGKEIYEGDYDQDYNVVTWCDRKMGWTMSIYDFPTKEFIACHCYDCEGHFEIRELEDIEIIGNIYEGTK